MVDTNQSPLAMLVLITPYTILYVVNELFLHGILDKIHYLFFELIFVAAFGRVFGLPDFVDRLFPSRLKGPINIQTVEGIQPIKTAIAAPNSTSICTTHAGSITAPAATKTGSKGTVGSIVEGVALRDSKPTTGKSTTLDDVVKKQEAGPYAKELAAMEKKFMDYIHNDDIWEKVYEDTSIKAPEGSGSEGWIQVSQYKARPMCYKIVAYMNNTAAVTFDALCELERRLEWDPMCVEARVLEEVTQHPGTTVQYVRTKAVWPTASRDTVVLGTVKDLGSKGLFMVNSSIEHTSMPERVKEKIVRMETAVAGHIITPDDDGTRCKLVQIVDADLKGWIPEKVIQMVSTKAVPDGLRAVNGLIPIVTPYSESKVLVKAAQAQEEANLKQTMMDTLHDQELKDMDPAEEELVPELDSRKNRRSDETLMPNTSSTRGTHTLRRQRSLEEDIPLSNLSDRLKVVEAEIENERQERQQTGRKHSKGGSTAGALEKTKSKNVFQTFWEGIKENLSHSFASKANKILIAAIVIAVLGSSVAKLKRR
ncbi:START domain-containing protein 10 [Mortierella sp. AM989]|nr:START domain-containing protein 10 [Mortierella sp. AM989]